MSDAGSTSVSVFTGLDATNDDPSIDIRGGLVVIGVFVGLLLLWSGTAPLDAAATATGQITVSGHDQIIQHREGGVVATVDVVEGQSVRAGQVLVELAPEDVGAEVRSLRAQSISLQAQRARLIAEVEGKTAIDWPASLASLSGDDLATAKDAMISQQAQFDAGLGALRVQQAINAKKAAGLGQQIEGSRGQLDSVVRQQSLLDQQLQGVRSLAEKGYASQNSVRALERSAADLSGARSQHAANIADYHQQMAQAQLESRDLEEQRALVAASALRQTEDQLNDVGPKLAAAHAQLERGTLRAQTDGLVTGLAVFAPGALVSPGQKLMEIVPTHRELVVDARVAAADVEGVTTGHKAEVRFLSLNSRQMPVLSGAVTQLSADSFTDDRTGQSYYTVEVTVPPDQLALLKAQGADSFIRPGVPAEVIIPLRKRSAFDYLFEPLSQALWKSFRQR
jgi:HlyD family secretion protein